MRKIICIGELSLNVVLDKAGNTVGAMPGGRIANAAAILGRNGFSVLMASEAADDPVGDITVSALSGAGVDVRSVDRYTEGRTVLNILTGEPVQTTRYEAYPDEAFDIIWPRIDENDIVVYGGFYALDRRMRPRLARLLSHAADRKATTVYLPGFPPQQEPRITRVMPEILENLETADIAMTRTADLLTIFGTGNPAKCYNDHISFYCDSLVNIDAQNGRIEYFASSGTSAIGLGDTPCASMLWNAGALAGLVSATAVSGYTSADFGSPVAAMRENMIQAAASSGKAATESSGQWKLLC